jgi:signal transduction histidine kinase
MRVMAPGNATKVRITLTDISQRKQAEMDRHITITTVDARETERLWISRQLHDDLGQRLSALKMNLASLPATTCQAQQDVRIAAMLDTLDEAVATVRRIATDLRPLMLNDLGLNAAIDWLARDSARRLGINVTLQLDDCDPPLDERNSVALFRMVQASLNQLAGDGRATRINISLEQSADQLLLTLQEHSTHRLDAVDPEYRTDSTMTVREQAHMLGGQLEFELLANRTRRIIVRLPLASGT